MFFDDEDLDDLAGGAAQLRIQERCDKEHAKTTSVWRQIDHDLVTNNHSRVAPGMFYGMNFPWNAEMLVEWGPEWLTRAFHAAGTIDESNRVTEIILDREHEVTTGNNGGKFLFDVVYENDIIEGDYHTKLFGKCPYPFEGKTTSDRLSSSVNKQPMEFYEVNTSRLLEASLPCKIPRFYFGDISNETSNYILITERVEFAGIDDITKDLEPGEIEGPYDKCLDRQTLKGPAEEYYLLLVRSGGEQAANYKTGKMGDREFLLSNFENFEGRDRGAWGVSAESTGHPRIVQCLGLAERFIFDQGAVLFPDYIHSSGVQEKFRNTMMLLNAYSAELNWWRHRDPDYLALTHNNMNVDNAFFKRDSEGKLELAGVFDWGNMGSRALGWKLWWWLYCGDHDTIKTHLDSYLQAFIDSYAEFGGPTLDKAELKEQFIVTGIEMLIGLIMAVPQINKMCPKKNWETITDRHDPRIAENIHGKSTLRLYLHCMVSIVRIIEEWKGDEVLQECIRKIDKELDRPPKSRAAIWGPEA